ncbi:MAG: dTDP-4-dehydrorhamnose reductase, partial [Candidatus Eremiobacteraeota bacterium]|nr:dTDP-4-dehydrorhamnose reductase [Candidatus Eremiobacteraeota bacterium]
TALHEAFAGREVVAPSHAEVPFEDTAALAQLLDRVRPAVLINCSAFHNVDVCEREPERAFAVNALAVDRAAQACAAREVAFATISTDYVFGGTLGRAYREDDAVGPLTAYGASKAAGEFLTRRHGPRHFVVRTSGVFGTVGTSNKGYTLIEKVLRQAERGEPTRMVADMVFSPSYAPHVARAIRDVIDANAFGTHHVTNAGAVSWYDFVHTAFERAGLGGAPLEATTYAAMNNPTRRPMHSPLENTTFARAGVAPLPAWQDALDEFLAARAGRALGASVG